MINFDTLSTRFFAGLAAVTMTATLFAGYFATPATANFVGVLA